MMSYVRLLAGLAVMVAVGASVVGAIIGALALIGKFVLATLPTIQPENWWDQTLLHTSLLGALTVIFLVFGLCILGLLGYGLLKVLGFTDSLDRWIG